MAAGRPTYWNKERKNKAVELIFNRIAEGESVRSILDNADRKIYPSWVTFNEWLSNDDKLSKQYARNCELRADLLFEEIINIADTPIDGVVIETDDNGRTKEKKGDMLGHRRLQIDSRKWILSKMNPKKYGDKIQTEHSGEIKGTEPNINLIVDGKKINLKE